MAAAAIFKSQKSRYLLNSLTDLYEIWQDYAKWVFLPSWPLKKFEFPKSKMAERKQ